MTCVRRSREDGQRRGIIAPLAAVLLVPLIGLLAVTLEGGFLMSQRRRVQATADAAALAASDTLFRNYPTYKGLDQNGQAKQAALALARDNGYTNDGTNSTVTVNIPPTSGNFAAKPGYAEVIVKCNIQRAFSRLWGSDSLSVKSRAVALGKWDYFNTGILVLDPASSGSLNAGGGGDLTLTGKAKIIVDSGDSSAVVVNGGGSIVASTVDIYGGYTTPGGGQLLADVHLGVLPTPDPLAYLPVPDPRSLPLQSHNPTHIVSGNKTLQPGVYSGGITIGGQANVTLQPGIYYMDGGGFSFTGQGALVGQGVMIYNAPKQSNDSISITGSTSSTVSITPPTSGLYAGMSLFQDRTANVSMSVSGNGLMNMTGTFYAARALLKITGNSPGNVIGSQYVSWQLNTGGTAGLTIDWSPSNTTKIRTIGLVE
jgi:hypothetical protein